MKIEYVGKKVFYTGKTLWEIVGNLKNVGVGRLVRMDLCRNAETIFKIIKVQPIPPPRKLNYRTVQRVNRGVIVWIEEMNKGIKRPVKKLEDECMLTKFKLIQKNEEGGYYKHFEELSETFKPKVFPKYTYCPPLYKLLWEDKRNFLKVNLPGPQVLRHVKEDEIDFIKITDGNETSPPSSCTLYQDAPVESLIKEIVRLKKLIKHHSAES